MNMRRLIGAIALSGMAGGCTNVATTSSLATRAVAAGPSVSCGSMDITNTTNGGLTVASGTPLSTSAALGSIRATLSGSATLTARVPALADPRLTVIVRGKQVMSAPVALPQGALSEEALIPAGIGPAEAPVWPWSNYYFVPTTGQVVSTPPVDPLCIAHFGGANPQTAVLVGTSTGGIHCCTVLDTYPVVSSGFLSSPLQKNFGNPQAGITEIGGHAVIITANNAFDYEFACYACSGAPVVTDELRGGKLVVTTDEHLDLVASDAGYWWGLFERSQAGQGLGVLAAWTADECTLGQGSMAFTILDQLETAGTLNNPNSGYPGGSAYISQLRRFLSSQGYAV